MAAVPSEELERAMREFHQTIDYLITVSEPKVTKGEQRYKPFTLVKYTVIEIHNKAQFLGWIFSAIYAKAYKSASIYGPAAQIMKIIHELEEGNDFKQEFMAVAKELHDSFFFLMMAKGRRTPASSFVESFLLLDAGQQETLSTSRKKRVKTQCLERDSYKCVISGTHDHKKLSSEFKGRETEIPDDWVAADLEVAYICAFSLGQSSTDTVLSSMEKFAKEILKLFDPAVTALLDDDMIDSPMNVMSLTPYLHQAFGDFRIYFEPTGDNSYEVKVWQKPYPLALPSSTIITFSNGANSSIDLPSKELLRLHRSIGRILHMSAAAESIELLFQHLDDVDVDEGGSTALGDLVRLQLLTGRTYVDIPYVDRLVNWCQIYSATVVQVAERLK
ncbi:hypothetical protein BDR22DRAFT_962953 [Usnea florida]